jgi:hypothetical protein
MCTDISEEAAAFISLIIMKYYPGIFIVGLCISEKLSPDMRSPSLEGRLQQ